MNKKLQPDFLFETSWEICNMLGGIYTVLSTKAKTLTENLGDQLIMIGPEVWKETSENPDFEEDKTLLNRWVEKAHEDGLNFRIGRWKIAGKPIVILVDFTQYFSKKDEIFKEYWETFSLDSLQGGWDYVEPAMFGYAAAKVIEHFYEYNVTAYDKIGAHFHEWMTGLGLLYLKKHTPQVATIFTTHATTLGRSIAGQGMPLHSKLKDYNPEEMARRLGVPSKFSMESLAAQKADVYTTVSDTTASECHAFFGREVDEVTPNGFDDAFAPSDEELNEHRRVSREVLVNLSKATKGKVPDKDAFFVATSGRYEYTNKGIDVFLEALNTLRNEQPSREIWGYVLVPADQKGPDKRVLERWNNPTDTIDEPSLTTHELSDPDNDPIVNLLKDENFINGKDEKVHIIFVPAYLNGKDGLLNLTYYQLLSGFDLTIFPSYYEPWGYTPLESMAYRVPTITTSLTGIGQWVKERYPESSPGIQVIDRNESNRDEVIRQIADTIKEILSYPEEDIEDLKQNAWEISRKALWSQLINHYYNAYGKALEEAGKRFEQYEFKEIPKEQSALSKKTIYEPQWKKILIEPSLPKNLEKLRELTRNIWWTWDHQAKKLLASIEDGLWEKYSYNPIHLLERMTYEQLNNLAADQDFLDRLDKVYERFKAYMDARKEQDPRTIAYFSMEYGLHDTIKTYSGGLGMLAGDYIKEASDSNVNMVAVGLLYRYGFFVQKITRNGEQQAEYIPQKFTHLPMIPVRDENDEWMTINLALPGRNLIAKIWKLNVGRVPLYLLDTDIEENHENDRFITHQLYGGDNENRFKQEFLLGIGGIRMLDLLNIHPTLYHINEGHAAFIGLEQLRKLIHERNLNFYQAREVVRGSNLFTTHTPVPAGHDAFDEDILRRYIPHYANRLNLNWDTFMGLGRRDPEDHNQNFSMSILAINLSQEVNGVSKLHGQISRDMFKDMYPGYLSEELHIGYVTNGVHYANWTSGSWRKLHNETFGKDWKKEMANPDIWKKIYDVKDEKIWEIRNYQRDKLVKYLKKRLRSSMMHQESPRMFRKIENELSPHKLTIGFARRFATYKRAHLLFKNLERLSAIINSSERPVQFVFAGKAHPNDKEGKDLLKWIIEISRREDFAGKILFVEDYDIRLARKMVQGVDLWLNTPTRPLEASGTSGEKAALNGVLNCSVLDGWWAEGYVEGAGWALPMQKAFHDQNTQDELDSETLYDLLEEEIIPAFYDRNDDGIPQKWTKAVKKNIAEIVPHFTTRRMLNDYFESFYNKLFNQNDALTSENYAGARELVRWKHKVWNVWEQIKVYDMQLPDAYDRPLKLGDHFRAEIKLNLPALSPEEIGIEAVFGHKEQDKVNEFVQVQNMDVKEVNGNIVTYTCDIPVTKAGVFDYAFRLYPKHHLLSHRQSFNLVKWL
ncbi:MAG: alpha-glucan family phosphorylase [Bacteroidales bacterium]|nr:alpha-glucan family phosphorylase [Bacteroidales bacterium]